MSYKRKIINELIDELVNQVNYTRLNKLEAMSLYYLMFDVLERDEDRFIVYLKDRIHEEKIKKVEK